MTEAARGNLPLAVFVFLCGFFWCGEGLVLSGFLRVARGILWLARGEECGVVGGWTCFGGSKDRLIPFEDDKRKNR